MAGQARRVISFEDHIRRRIIRCRLHRVGAIKGMRSRKTAIIGLEIEMRGRDKEDPPCVVLPRLLCSAIWVTEEPPTAGGQRARLPLKKPSIGSTLAEMLPGGVGSIPILLPSTRGAKEPLNRDKHPFASRHQTETGEKRGSVVTVQSYSHSFVPSTILSTVIFLKKSVMGFNVSG